MCVVVRIVVSLQIMPRDDDDDDRLTICCIQTQSRNFISAANFRRVLSVIDLLLE